jgi:hypothetical protein
MCSAVLRNCIVGALAAALCLIGSESDAQVLRREKVQSYSQKLENEPSPVLGDTSLSMFAPAAVRSLGPGETGDVFLLTSNLPVSFSRLEKDADGNWRVGANMSLGASYGFMVAKGRGLQDGSIEFDPQFYVGVTGNLGLSQDLEESGVKESLMIGGVIGFSDFNALIGYDILVDTPVFGIGTRVNVQAITGGLATILAINKDSE